MTGISLNDDVHEQTTGEPRLSQICCLCDDLLEKAEIGVFFFLGGATKARWQHSLHHSCMFMGSPFPPSMPSAPVLTRESSTPGTSSRSRSGQGSFLTERTPTRDPAYDGNFLTTPSRAVRCESCAITGEPGEYNLFFLDPNPPLTQPRHNVLTTPPNIPQGASFDSTDFQDIDVGIGQVPVVNSAFIDAVAQSMGFRGTDEDYRNSLHSIPMVCCGARIDVNSLIAIRWHLI